MGVKKCFIPNCKSTNKNNDKIFFTVPKSASRRTAWHDCFSKRPYKIRMTEIYCCEDHFDLEKDTDNWMYFKSMLGSRLRLRENAIPHKFLILPDKNQPTGSQFTDEDKKTRLEIEEYRKNLSSNSFPSTSAQTEVCSEDTSNPETDEEPPQIETITRYVASRHITTNEEGDARPVSSTNIDDKNVENDMDYNTMMKSTIKQELEDEVIIEMDPYAYIKEDYSTSTEGINDHYAESSDIDNKEFITSVKLENYSDYEENIEIEPNIEIKEEFNRNDQEHLTTQITENEPKEEINTEYEKPNYECTKCDFLTTRYSSLQVHIKKCNGTDNKQIENRRKEKKPVEYVYQCRKCDKQFTIAGSLKSHMLSHTFQKPYKCKFCNKAFKTATLRTSHQKNHMEPQFKCELCDKMFVHRAQLKIHAEVHSGETYACTVCKKIFTTATYLRHHMKLHTAELRFKCEICERGFVYRCNLRVHMRTHGEEKPFECSICGKAFGQHNKLKKHMAVHGPAEYECKLCNESFKCYKSLRVHMGKHTGQSFQCDLCDKSFLGEINLQRHKRTHIGDKPFVCKICGKSYERLIYIESHMKVHTETFPIMCKTCIKVFPDNQKLEEHMKMHIVGIIYKCDVCNRTFKYEDSFIKHIHVKETPQIETPI